MDINIVAEELYALPPEGFTAARNVTEKEAKAIGDKHLAGAIHQLRKPSIGAWLANQLVREHPGEVQSFVDLGAALREATVMLSGDQLRELRAGLLTDTLQGEGFPPSEAARSEIEASRLEQEHRRAQTDLESANRTGQVVARRLGEAVQRREGLSRE